MGQTLFIQTAQEEYEVVPRSNISNIQLSLFTSCLQEKTLTLNCLFLCLIFVELLILIWKNQQQKRLLENGCKSDFASNCVYCK